ncbi:MAG TPA: hypothetical protein VFX76_07205 [Roseiflexaceae bacterium]|nr:hypothetical protein [Roseiflexaceae bacterium]
MLKSILLALGAAIAAYVIAVVIGMWAINTFSSNTHDRSLEAAMTAAFVIGPLAAIITLVVALVLLLGRAKT